MTAINRSPAGWLGFLGIKNFGRNPSVTADLLSPTWDLSQLYLNAAAEYGNIGLTPIPGPGNNVVFGGEADAFAIDSFSVYLQSGAGEAVTVCLARIRQDNAFAVLLEDSYSIGATAVGATTLSRPVFLQAGEFLGVNVLSLTGAPQWAVRWRYTRLQS